MKLSLIVAPLIAAKVPHEVIMETILAFEAQQTDALEKRRANDRERQNRKRLSRDVTGGHTGSRSRARGEDSSSKKHISEERKKEDASPAAQPKKGARIPDDFSPDIEAAVAEGLSRPDAERHARSFCDYWRARPGKEGLKLDWQATWRVWFRRQLGEKPRSTSPPNRKPSPFDAYDEIAQMKGWRDEPAIIPGSDEDVQRLPAIGCRPSGPVVDL